MNIKEFFLLELFFSFHPVIVLCILQNELFQYFLNSFLRISNCQEPRGGEALFRPATRFVKPSTFPKFAVN